MKCVSVMLSVFLVLVVSSCSRSQNDSTTVEVEQILKSPTSFVGQTIVVQGIVNQVNDDKQLFSVISQREFLECGIGSCNINAQLPIRYRGQFPSVGKQIQITGKISQVEKGFVYEAQSVKNIEAISADE